MGAAEAVSLYPGIRIGTAGWSIPRALAERLPGSGSHLARYAQALSCAEINTSFYRHHRPEVYARWAAQTPEDFRFAVKLPRSITHERGLRASREPLIRFFDEVAGLADRLGALLIQLPPSLAFEARPVGTFFGLLRSLFDGAVVCEPRHPTWFEAAADRLWTQFGIGRVAADPARVSAAALPGGWLGTGVDGLPPTVYHRWHGSPRMYFSAYDRAWLHARAESLMAWPADGIQWCIFDNTGSGAALGNALHLQELLQARRAVPGGPG